MARFPTLLLAALFLPAALAHGDSETSARIYYEKLSAESPSFFMRTVESVKDGKRLVITTYTDKEGKELAREENTLEGNRLLRSVYKQHQVDEQGELYFKDGKAFFSFTDKDGTETDSEDIEPDMILGSMIGEYLERQWDALMKGETTHVRYLAIERCETIGFKFFKDKEYTQDGKPVVDILMKPSSFFIAALVDPIRFTFTKEEKPRMIRVVGRTPIRWPKNHPPKNRGDWRAIDARIEMDPPKEAPAPAPAPLKKPAKPAK